MLAYYYTEQRNPEKFLSQRCLLQGKQLYRIEHLLDFIWNKDSYSDGLQSDCHFEYF
jgi:hypothetical protein